MITSPEIPPRVYRALSERINQNIHTPAGAEALAIDIESETGIHLGVNTIKRFLGIIESPWPPRKRTLDVIAQYLGYPDYKTMNNGKVYFSSRYSPRGDILIDMERFYLGMTIEINWTPNSRIVLFHISKGKFEVKQSKNCLLEKGDILHLTQLARGYRFIADKVFRNQNFMGTYIASEDTKITEISILKYDMEYNEAHREPRPYELALKNRRAERRKLSECADNMDRKV